MASAHRDYRVIASDQFTNLPDEILVAFSSRQDGTVLDKSRPIHDPEIIKAREKICHDMGGVRYDQVVYQRIVYSDKATYDTIVEVDQASTVAHTPEVSADAIFTRQRGVGLFLPVADCIPTIIFDPRRQYLALLHMGRHSTFTDVLCKMVQKFVSEGSVAADLQVWMGPAATKTSYVLEYFEHEHAPAWQGFFEKNADGYYLDMQGYNQQMLESAGVPVENITISSIDTLKNDDYFSHSAGDTYSRFACIAMMR